MFGIEIPTVSLAILCTIAIGQVFVIAYYIAFIARALRTGKSQFPACFVPAEYEDEDPRLTKPRTESKTIQPQIPSLPIHLKMN